MDCGSIKDATLAQYDLILEDFSSEDEHQSVSVTVKVFRDLFLKVPNTTIFCQQKFLAVLQGLGTLMICDDSSQQDTRWL